MKKVVNVAIEKLNSTMEKIVDTAVGRCLATGPIFHGNLLFAACKVP